ncbi:lysophospholipid acyltransferase family protein [Sporolactobacillus laevolacticus]|uniref:lysophospholipid acyltransferase family protein n=1 Tax=Sporolactobacillus laevolacticus TaxID=33018 RepID=UPI0025B5A4A1|nr:lysophospholipid acyltransferase family protein [Sporolactobacillus laevolacticus]MDN3953637.1 lysophospholipid acyltransferase family protein [Sporolactobacillus laevolacticus]
MNLYPIGKPLAKLYYHLFFKITVIGSENIPKQGGVLICSNHLSNFDPPFIGVSISRELSFIAKSELFKVPVLGVLLRHLNSFPVRRGEGDRGAIRVALKLIREGHALLLFPEGHRNLNQDAQLKQALSGAGFFALKTDAVVVPCAIIGRYKFRSKMKIVFGKPVDTTAMKNQKLKSSEASAVIMRQIQALLDEHAGPTA